MESWFPSKPSHHQNKPGDGSWTLGTLSTEWWDVPSQLGHFYSLLSSLTIGTVKDHFHQKSPTLILIRGTKRPNREVNKRENNSRNNKNKCHIEINHDAHWNYWKVPTSTYNLVRIQNIRDKGLLLERQRITWHQDSQLHRLHGVQR